MDVMANLNLRNSIISPSINVTRRTALSRMACGFGSLALGGMLHDQWIRDAQANGVDRSGQSFQAPHFQPRAKRVIFIFMQGGPSHVDSFDYKPKLIADHDRTIPFQGVRFDNFREMVDRRMMKPLWDFKQYGDCGRYVSDLFPEIGSHADDLCFIHSLHTEGVAHGPSTLFLHTGSVNTIRPSVGSWISYGLGSENQNMPAFVTIVPPPRMGGPQNYGSAFLPAVHQGSPIGKVDQPIRDAKIKHLINQRLSPGEQRQQFDFLQSLNQAQMAEAGHENQLEAAIDSFEIAFRMQNHAPQLMDMSSESKATLDLYGINNKVTEDFGRQCLMARRMAESGVRYIQVNYADSDGGNPRWDQHSNMPRHKTHAQAVDLPVAGLLTDLKSRGLLEDTLVWFGGEFGRTPFAQGKDGRDHNPAGFTMWLAGGGVKPGFAYGATDEYGYAAMENKVHMHDMHATLLHLLGMDHEKLTYRFAGRDFRLTDVHGRVVHEIFA